MDTPPDGFQPFGAKIFLHFFVFRNDDDRQEDGHDCRLHWAEEEQPPEIFGNIFWDRFYDYF
jgi:hypothetical protein